jgi:hypothetical protein
VFSHRPLWKVTGLLGDNDGNAGDDFRTRAGGGSTRA